VPGDISSAAFFLVAGLLVPGSELTIEGVGVNPTRTGLLDVLRKMGAYLTVKPRAVGKGEEPVADLTVRASKLKGVQVWGATVPRMVDEFPILAVAATQAQGTTVVRNAEDLRVKESNRIEAVTAFLTQMGAHITSTSDGWIIKGPTPLKGVTVDSHGDHRIAMSAAIAALVATGPTVIRDVDNIETSFPGFEKLLAKVVKR
jgi:3-phosphoshikimate 1-carboxyvinyltransferase